MSSTGHTLLSTYRISAIMLFCGMMALPAFAQVDCLTLTNRSPTVPAPFSGNDTITGAYDSLRQVTVYHLSTGGVGGNITWEWNGISWANVSTAGPDIFVPNDAAVDMVFDSSRGVCVAVVNLAVWEWNGVTWTNRNSSLNPGPQAINFDLAFDSKRDVVLTFGGQFDNAGTMLSRETWEYDGTMWSQQFPVNAPPARRYHKMSYDADRDVVVLFGGQDDNGLLNETWEYDRVSDSWLQRNTHVGAMVPLARKSHGMAYDSVRKVTVMYAGSRPQFLGDIWEWDGQDWMLRGPILDAITVGDLARHKPVVAYDSARQRTVMIGGLNSVTSTLVLELLAPSAPQITLQPVSQTVIAGQPAIFSVMANAADPLFYQWRFNGVDIVDATQASYAISAASSADAGVYDVVVGLAGHDPFSCPQTISDPVILVVNQAVPGDVDGDGDFDLEDLAISLPGFTGPLP